MASNQPGQDTPRTEEDSYAIIERLADAIRIEDDARISSEDRCRLIQDLYEGPRKCQCCINWIDEVPPDADLDAVEKDEDSHPLILRRRVRPGEGKTQVEVHSIEVRNAEARAVLCEVFKGFDSIHPGVKYLIFLAPFKQFFWRWERFEKAIEDEKDEVVKTILLQLRAIVKDQLAEAFAVNKELVTHGMITHKHLWVIFPPGELLYSCDDENGLDGSDRFFLLRSSVSRPDRFKKYSLNCRFVDWDGDDFGYITTSFGINSFKGNKPITDLVVFPAKYLPDLQEVQDRCVKRGRKFHELAGMVYKSYSSSDDHDHTVDNSSKARPSQRIILDAKGSLSYDRGHFVLLQDPNLLSLATNLIRQAPIQATPAGGHIPLPPVNTAPPGFRPGFHAPPPPHPFPIPVEDDDYDDYEPRRPNHGGLVPPPPHHLGRGRDNMRRRRSIASFDSVESGSDDSDDEKEELSDLQLQLCNSRMLGFCLKTKKWRTFNVNRIHDIEWNTTPFETLVLPDGYKDLILSFVESQLKEGDTFDDVINGKGGGLVILLAGDPGVGKTLTAESVAEKIHAPLYKMDLASLKDDSDDDRRSDNGSRSKCDGEEEDIATAFDHAARWKAVLLIDECDMYLERRGDGDAASSRNKIVARFLQELEYYPSLLFLTTNREKVLDPAIYSRIHLTINYPALDAPARRTIWQTFLEREPGATVTQEEIEKLADIDVNGRRIRNITKTAKIMAKRAGRGITFEDIRHVMRITEGVMI